MTGATTKLSGAMLCIVFVAAFAAVVVSAQENRNNLIDVESPTFFNYNSPLRQPDSLRSRPYFDFLSTLYRRDAAKTELFRPYVARTRREAAPVATVVAADVAPIAAIAARPAVDLEARAKRAIVFRPLFVYKQQQVRKQKLAAKRRV